MYPAMLRPSATAAKLRSWRVIIMRSRANTSARSKLPIASGPRSRPSSCLT
jgi:hypothetical protein